jgi:hypothetical protein
VPALRDMVSVDLQKNLCVALPAEACIQTTSPVETKGYMNILKLPDWRIAHNILTKCEKTYQNGKKYLNELCSFSSAYKDGAFPFYRQFLFLFTCQGITDPLVSLLHREFFPGHWVPR